MNTFAENHMVLPVSESWDEQESCEICGKTTSSLAFVVLTEQPPVELSGPFASLPVNVLACNYCYGVVTGEIELERKSA